MKLIFLDVDGVLNHSKSPGWVGAEDNHVLDKDCVDQINRVILQTGAKVVLSSSWRVDRDAKEVVEHALVDGCVIGRTAVVLTVHSRREEILHWIGNIWPCTFNWNDAEVIEQLAVIDDDDDADLHDNVSFFQTDFENMGLTKEIADGIIQHLNKDRFDFGFDEPVEDEMSNVFD